MHICTSNHNGFAVNLSSQTWLADVCFCVNLPLSPSVLFPPSVLVYHDWSIICIWALSQLSSCPCLSTTSLMQYSIQSQTNDFGKYKVFANPNALKTFQFSPSIVEWLLHTIFNKDYMLDHSRDLGKKLVLLVNCQLLIISVLFYLW